VAGAGEPPETGRGHHPGRPEPTRAVGAQAGLGGGHARPTGSRSRAPTSAPRGGRPSPRTSTSTRPTGSRSRAPTSAPRGGRPSPRSRTSLVPRAAVLARPLQHLEVAALAAYTHVLSSHGQPFSRAHFSTSRWPPSAAYAHVSSSHGQPFSRAHFSTSRWPPFAAYAHVPRPTGSRSRAPTSAPRGGRPPPRARTSTRPTGSRSRAPTSAPRGGRPRRARARPLVPRAAVLARPLQHLEVAALAAFAHVHSSHGQSFSRAHFSTSRWPPSPRRAHVPRPTGSRSRAPTSAPRGGRPPPRTRTSLVPRAAVLARPLQHLEVAALRRVRARLLVPRVALLRRIRGHRRR
jgi:hypothetical protein